MVQVVNEASETVYCVSDAAVRLKQHKNFTPNTYQLIYQLDDVSTMACIVQSCIVFCIKVKLKNDI